MYRAQDNQAPNMSSIKLIKFPNGQYEVHSYRKVGFDFRGSLKDAIYVLCEIGVPFESIETAYLEMELNSHNVAEFGVLNKTFLYSRYVEDYAEKSGFA